MSTPPPFDYRPGPASGPGAYDRRTLKARRRAAAQQAQSQQAQLRNQMKSAQRTSIVGPLLLLFVGTVLLLLETGRLQWPAALAWLGRWWPAILIVAGLVLVIEWGFDRRQVSPTGAPLASRRILGGSATALLFLLALLGAGVMAAQNSSTWARQHMDQDMLQRHFGDWRQIFGIHGNFTQNLHAPLSPNGRLTIEDPRGDITVTGSSQDGEVHVITHQHIFTWQGDQVERRQRAEAVRFTGDRAELVLTAAPQDQDDADLTIELPHESPLTIHSAHGDISIEELRGAVEVNAQDGDVKLTALRGPVHLSTQDDDAEVTAHSLSGGFTLDGRTGDITLSDVDGPVLLHGDFFGTTHLERIHGPVHFQTSFTDFTCAGLPGDLTVEGRSDLAAHRLQGPVTLTTTNRNLTLEAVRGAATITDRNGSVDLTLVGPLLATHVTNENGSVEVSVPADQAFTVHAQTRNGKIENDFGFPTTKSEENTDLRGQLREGGQLLVLTTTEGDVNLRRGSAETASDWTDDPQRITPVPNATVKHSKPKTATTQD